MKLFAIRVYTVVAILALTIAWIVTAPAQVGCTTPAETINMVKIIPGFVGAREFKPAEVAAMNKQAEADSGLPPGDVDTIVAAFFSDGDVVVFIGSGGKVCQYFEADEVRFNAFLARAFGQVS